MRDTGDVLVAAIQSALTAGMAAINAIPVDALPEAMASTARTGVVQAAQAAGTALGTASSTAKQQLGPLTQQLTGVIDQARTQAQSMLAQGKTGLLTQLAAARQAVTAASQTVTTQINTVLTTLETQLTQRERGVSASIDAIVGPVVAQAGRVVTDTGGALAALIQTGEAKFAAIEAASFRR